MFWVKASIFRGIVSNFLADREIYCFIFLLSTCFDVTCNKCENLWSHHEFMYYDSIKYCLLHLLALDTSFLGFGSIIITTAVS